MIAQSMKRASPERMERVREKTVAEKVERLRHAQFVENKYIFAEQFSTFHKAAFDGSLNGVTHFLKMKEKKRSRDRKISMDDRDELGMCAIHYAAVRGHAHIVEHLLNHRCPPDLVNREGYTALMYACQHNRLDCIKILLQFGARLDLVNMPGMTAIHLACQADTADAITLCFDLITAEADRLAEIEANKNPYLLDINEADEAEAEGDSADAKGKDTGGNMEEEETIEEDIRLDIAKIFEIACKSGLRALHVAAMNDSLNSLQFLIRQRVQIDAVDSVKETPLHKAAKRGASYCYRALVTAGASERHRNAERKTPKQLFQDDVNIY